MKKGILTWALFGVFATTYAQQHYYAPQIQLTAYTQPVTTVGYDFGYSNTATEKMPEGYYLWLENQWYQVVNAKNIFKTSANKLAFTLDEQKTQKLALKDADETIFYYPIEALDKYKITSSQFTKMADVVVDNKTNTVIISSAKIKGNEVDIEKTIEEKSDSKLLDELSITTQVVEKVVPYDVDKKEENTKKTTPEIIGESSIRVKKKGNEVTNQVESSSNSSQPEIIGDSAIRVKKKRNEITNQVESSSDSSQPEIIGESSIRVKKKVNEATNQVENSSNSSQPEIIGESSIRVKKKRNEVTNQVESSSNSSQPEIIGESSIRVRVKQPKNDYEKAVDAGFEGTVTEWIDEETKKNGISPYEVAVKNGFEGTEQEYKRSLWGSALDPKMEKKERDAKLVMDWLAKVGTSEGLTPYERALKNGFYGSFTEWVEFVIGKDGEKVYQDEVAQKKFSGTYREWVESKLDNFNKETERKDAIKSQQFIAVPNLKLSIPENDDEVVAFSLYDYYQMYFGNSAISSSDNGSNSYQIKPTELEYQVTWFNRKEITITSISKEGILYYKKNPEYTGATTQINIKYVIK